MKYLIAAKPIVSGQPIAVFGTSGNKLKAAFVVGSAKDCRRY